MRTQDDGSSSGSWRCRSSLRCCLADPHSPCSIDDTASARRTCALPPTALAAPQTLSHRPNATPVVRGTDNAPAPSPPACLDTFHPPRSSAASCLLLPSEQRASEHLLG